LGLVQHLAVDMTVSIARRFVQGSIALRDWELGLYTTVELAEDIARWSAEG
jgi:hypothetical protein